LWSSVHLAPRVVDSRGRSPPTKTSPFVARGITRNPDSDKTKALASQGVQMMAANFDDARSLERAFAGASAAYCVTNYWEHFSPEREVAQARNMANAAKPRDWNM
jgi:uncharacterized protein YbjT (DUF2867 family)